MTNHQRARNRLHPNQQKITAGIRQRIIVISLGFLYCILILISYAFTISPTHAYAGLKWVDLPSWCYFVSFLFAIVPLLWMPVRITRPSDISPWIFYACIIAPSAFIPFHVLDLPLTEIIPLPFSLVAVFALFEFLRRQRPFRIPRVQGSQQIFLVWLPILMILLIFITFMMGNFTVDLSFANVYQRRYLARQLVVTETIMAYAIGLLNGVCVPISIILAMLEKKKWYYGLVLAAMIAVFSLKGEKGAIALPLALMMIIHLSSNPARYNGVRLMVYFNILIAASIIEFYIFNSDIISVYIIRRQFIMPAQLTSYYWEFFSVNPHVMLTDSVFNKILNIEPPYELYTPMLIGNEYFGNPQANANANIWGSGFAHFGYPGMVIVSVLSSLILRICDSMAKNNRFVLASAICGVISLIWTNAALHTSMFSNGIAMLIIAFFLYPASFQSSGLLSKLRGNIK